MPFVVINKQRRTKAVKLQKKLTNLDRTKSYRNQAESGFHAKAKWKLHLSLGFYKKSMQQRLNFLNLLPVSVALKRTPTQLFMRKFVRPKVCMIILLAQGTWLIVLLALVFSIRSFSQVLYSVFSVKALMRCRSETI